MNKVSLHNETPEKAPEPNWPALFDAIEEVLEREIEPITVVFVTEERSRQINESFRQINHETNVLSFEELREIYVCPSVVKKEAAESSVDYSDWMTRIIVHGILHLEGFGHDSDSEAQEMEDKEKRVLQMIGISIL